MHALQTHIAKRFHQRLMGLMFSSQLPINQALFIPNCVSIHTCFMRYPIDLVYVDDQGVITALVEQVKPWRMSRAKKPAKHVVELAAGGIARSEFYVGQHTLWRY